ncbi:hypothetical protein D030_0295A, partial [Vibrio parahaemolyticus AQ3810]|jgi:hypothetical protein
MKIG